MHIKILGTLIIVFGVFLFVGVASASDTEVLQPAADITYNENVTINGTARVDSIHVGEEGVGGVTYFNGTIVNIGSTTPVTFGDDVRIDGEIWRGTSKGTADNMPLKISDSIIPTLDKANDFGSATNRWKNVYYSGMLQGNDANLSGDLYISGVLTCGSSVVVDDDLEVNQTLIVSNDSTFTGDISQSINKFGAVKASAYINSDCSIIRQRGPNNITCTHFGIGGYLINFGFNVKNNNYFQITPYITGAANIYASGYFADDQTVGVIISKPITTTPGQAVQDAPFLITIY